METIPKEQIIKRFQILPEVLQNTLFSDQTADTIGKTCQLRDVDENSLSLVAALTGRVLLGYLRPENFAAEIQKEAGINGVVAAQVAHDIDGEIFSSVRLELKKLYPPTIQTPTVQAQGFAYQAPQPPAAAVRRAPEPARPYVVPIPEKFRSRSAWPSQQPQGEVPAPVASQSSAPMPAVEIKEVPAVKEPSALEKEIMPAVNKIVPPQEQRPVAPAQPAPKPVESTPLSDIKPIVPLPTFIQSKFKETLKQTTGETQTTQENPAMKGAFTKFTESHTAVKPAEQQQPESIYREQIAEPQKTQDRAPMSGTQKAEGKVVDLSGL